MEQRFLTQKYLRSALYLKYQGLCALCKKELDHGWHADHIVPFCESGQTSLEGMQPLCPSCHHKKTAQENKNRIMKRKKFDPSRYLSDSFFKPRGHQRDFIKWIETSFLFDRKNKVCTMHATPGAGKSKLVAILAQLLEIEVAETIVWVVPRDSLKKQGAEGFCDNRWNSLYYARETTNKVPLVPRQDVKDGVRCLTTTYQSVSAQPEIWADWFDRHRSILVLDEVQHVFGDTEEDANSSTWLNAITPLGEKSVLTLAMTGTVERHDGKCLPFFEYKDQVINGEKRKVAIPVIEYRRSDALEEKAKLPIQFTLAKGWAKFVDKDGVHEFDVSDCAKGYEKKIVRAIIEHKKFPETLLTESIEHYIAYRRHHENAKFIGVFSGQREANQWKRWAKKKFPGLKIGIAVSDHRQHGDSIKGRDAIDFFKLPNSDAGSYDVLFTVGMAYEGLDVPSATHLACLTKTRSKSWLEQCFDRVTRIDYEAISIVPYEQQQGFIWVPDDPLMQEVVEYIQLEQQEGILQRQLPPKEPQDKDGKGNEPREDNFVALDSRKEDHYYADTEKFFSDAETRLVEAIRQVAPLFASAPPKTLLELYHKKVIHVDTTELNKKLYPPVQARKQQKKDLNYYLSRPDGHKELVGECSELGKQIDVQVAREFGTTPQFGKTVQKFGKISNLSVRELLVVKQKLQEQLEEGVQYGF